MFQVYNNIMILAMEKNLCGIFLAGSFAHGGFFLQGIHPERNLFNDKVFFLHLFTFTSYNPEIPVLNRT